MHRDQYDDPQQPAWNWGVWWFIVSRLFVVAVISYALGIVVGTFIQQVFHS